MKFDLSIKDMRRFKDCRASRSTMICHAFFIERSHVTRDRLLSISVGRVASDHVLMTGERQLIAKH